MSNPNKITGHQSMQITFFDTELQTAVQGGAANYGNNIKMSGNPDPGSNVTGCTIGFHHSTSKAKVPAYVAADLRIYIELPHHLYAEYLRVLQSGKQLAMTYEEVDGAPNARLYASF